MCRGNPFCGCHVPAQSAPREYGDEHTPLNQGFTRRFDNNGETERLYLDEMATGFPQIHTGQFREASPTGKPGGGVVTPRMPPQNIDSADVRPYLFRQPPSLPGNTRMIETGGIDPWETVNGKAPVLSDLLIGARTKTVG